MLDGLFSFVNWVSGQVYTPLGMFLFPIIGMFVVGFFLAIFRLVKSFNIFN